MDQGKLIHVVDDEEPVRRSLDFLLRTSGFRVERWCDGESFLKGVKRDEPACVLLDVRMPGMNGLQVQEEMRRRGLNLPIVVLTGHGDVETAVKAMQAGAVDFIEKPFERGQLLQALELSCARLADRAAQREQQHWAKTQIAALTEREREVLDGLACGYPNKTVAFDLGISSRTVEVYRANAMSKLEVTNFADALRIAFAAGLGSEKEWRRTHPGGCPSMQGHSAPHPAPVASALSVGEEQRKLAVPQHASRHAAQQRVECSTEAVRSHDDKRRT